MTESSTEEGGLTVAARASADRRILCPVLIGRDAELGQLDALLRESVSGEGRAALVSGEAGIGKTAMVRHFIQRARTKGARVLSGECAEIDARRPFGPFMDIARVANRLATLPVAPSDAAMAGTDRYQLHSAFTTLLAELARDRPVVVAIEDLHWADEASLELFPHIAQKLRDVPLLLIGSYRSDELHRRHPLRPVLAELSRRRLADDVALRRLSEDEVADFLREAMRLDRPPTAEFRRAIFETCEGNPLFMEEVLRALAERGDVEYREGSWHRTKEVADIAIPDTLRDAVLERFTTLPAEAQKTLRYAAVIGQRFDFDLLLRVTASDETTLVNTVRAAIEAQLVLEIANGLGPEHYAFRHALTRESILLELLQRERRRMHATVGAAIASRAGEDPTGYVEELAYHFDEAGDHGRAFRYLDLAAREAHRLFAFARAARHLERAVEVARDDEPALGELQLRLADAASLAASPRRALRAAQEARAWFEEAGDPLRAGMAVTRIAAYRWALGDSRAAKATALEAVRLLEPGGKSEELAGAYAQVARLTWLDLELSMAADWGKRAVDMAREEEAFGIEVDALITLGSADGYAGRPEGATRLRQAIETASAHDMVEAAVRGFSNLACPVLYATGSSAQEVRRVYKEMFAYARSHHFRTDMVIYFEAYCVLADGDWDAALRFMREVAGSYPGWTALIQLLEAYIRVGRDGPQGSLPLLDVSNRLLHEVSAGHQVYGAGLLARTALLAGDARRTLEHADAIAAQVGRSPWPEVDEAAIYALSAAIAQDDREARSRWIGLALAEHDGPRRATATARRAFAQAERAVSEGDVSAAIDLLGESAAVFEQEIRPFAETIARRRRAELLLRRVAAGDREAAQAEVGAILPYWRKAKATWYLGQLERWAADHGLAFPVDTVPASAAREARSQLTSRERQVAGLVALGLSNKEIAEKLVISERTAEGHVERILGKLGFRSRAQIASWQAGGDPTPPLS